MSTVSSCPHPRQPTQITMSATLLDAAEGIVTITLAGKLSPEDLAAAHASAGAYLRNWAGGSMLIHGERFEGWTREGDWADLAFQTANDDLIRKMAIVGDTRWKDLVVIFTAKRMRPFPIEYFPSGQTAEALAWLKS